LANLLAAQPKSVSTPRMPDPEDGYTLRDGVAVVPMIGTFFKRGTGLDWVDHALGIISAERMTAAVQSAAANPDASAILLQIDSSGGETRGRFDLADAVFAARDAKPVIAIADEWAYSAGYLVASAAERIFVPRTGGIGSIGVYALRVDMTQMDANLGIKVDV